jgi:acyl-CoA synthetase (AMP-forming)/AMP-acid ligase II
MAESDHPQESCEFGLRLLPGIIDERAITHPDDAYASVPNTPQPQDGFKNISYGTFANAINRCAWWIEDHLGRGQNFETLVYVGPNDLRFSILTVAAVKTGHKVRFLHVLERSAVLLTTRPGNVYLAKEQLCRTLVPS